MIKFTRKGQPGWEPELTPDGLFKVHRRRVPKANTVEHRAMVDKPEAVVTLLASGDWYLRMRHPMTNRNALLSAESISVTGA